MTSCRPERCRPVRRCRPRLAWPPAAVALAALALAGCGGGGSGTGAPPGPYASGAANRAPTIYGVAPRSVVGGTSYAFRPTASDADGDSLTFASVGRPAWATFDPSTGWLRGTPTPNDVGSSALIAISVSDGRTSAALASFALDVVATATGSVSLTWEAPQESEDGTPLGDLAGYKLYWSMVEEEGSYPNSVTLMNPGVTRYVVEQLTPAEWHFVMTAVDSRGIESEYSNLAVEEVLQ